MDFGQQIEDELDYYVENGEASPTLFKLLSEFPEYLADDFIFLVFQAVEHSGDPDKLKQILEKDAKEHHELYENRYPEYTALQNALLRRFCADV